MKQIVINGLAAATLICDISILFLLLYFLLRPVFKIIWLEKALDFFSRQALPLAFLFALTATGGSLFYSEIVGVPICKLCWFQRILMYPQSLILGLAVYFKDINIRRYIRPLCLVGGLISTYHYYLQLFLPLVNTCSVNDLESCSQKISLHYGYITIPVMALTAFMVIFILMTMAKDGRYAPRRDL